MLNSLDLNRLRIFGAVYRARSVTGAARTLSVTPSAVSQALSSLERQLGTRLFQRLARKLSPTPQADSLFLVLERFSTGLESCLRDWRSSAKEPAGVLRIGAPLEFGSRQLVDTIAGFSKYQQASFRVRFALPDLLMSELVDGRIDLALCDDGPFLTSYRRLAVWRPVFFEKAVMICSPRFYSRAVQGDHSYRHLSALPHVEYRDDSSIMALWYRHHFGKAPPSLNLRLTANHVAAMVNAALHGIGLAFVPEYLVNEYLRRGKLVKIEMPGKDYVNPIQLVQLKDKVPTLLERRFVDALSAAGG